jgi:hypothetical protein
MFVKSFHYELNRCWFQKIPRVPAYSENSNWNTFTIFSYFIVVVQCSPSNGCRKKLSKYSHGWPFLGHMWSYIKMALHCKKELAVFPSPAGMSLIKLFLGGNNLVFSRPERVWSVTSQLGTGKWLTLFYSVQGF